MNKDDGVCKNRMFKDTLFSDEDHRDTLVNYLMKYGYLTRGFVGYGPVRVGFVQNMSDYGDNIIGMKLIRSDPNLECEVLVVKILAQSTSDNFSSATAFAQEIGANKCVVAAPFVFDADDTEIATQMGVGLVEIQGKTVREIGPAKFMKSRFVDFPIHKFDGLELVQKFLEISESDWGHIARVFCRAEGAWCGFKVGGVFVEFEKSAFVLDVRISVRAGPLMKCASYSFKFGELAGFIVNGGDDRYTFVEKLGNMFVFTQSDWNFMLQLLSKVDTCHLDFYVGTARIFFAKHLCQNGLDLEMDFVDGRDSEYKYRYCQGDLDKLTNRKSRRTVKDKSNQSEGEKND